jgi:hypothetical protein
MQLDLMYASNALSNLAGMLSFLNFSSYFQEMFYILEVLELFQEIKEKLKEADKKWYCYNNIKVLFSFLFILFPSIN